MSWFSRKRSFVEDTDILAPDFEAEFDNIAEALNSLVGSGRIASSKSQEVHPGTFTEEIDVSGATVTFTLARPSVVIVTTAFDLQMNAGTGSGKAFVQGKLNVDGSNQGTGAELGVAPLGFIQATIGEAYRLQLGAGAHTLKLRLGCTAEGPATSAENLHASATFFYYPDPEP